MKHVKLMNEYGVDFPLWVDGFHHGEAPFTGLPEGLRDRLRFWADSFEENYDPFRGWASTASQNAHAQEAQLLLAALRDALGAEVEVELDLWEA